jgi:hypothetical protein
MTQQTSAWFRTAGPRATSPARRGTGRPGPGMRRVGAFGTALLTLATLALGTGATPSSAASPGSRPAAIVAMGDSFASGEGGGDYENGSNRAGDWCHRSRGSAIQQAAIPGVTAVNLACSGATTENVRLGGTPWNTERPQAEQLRDVARRYQVKMITLTVGTNDIPFVLMVVDCIRAYFQVGPSCSGTWSSVLPGRLRALEPRLVRVLTDIRAVMRDAGYRDKDYQLVVESYAAPVAPRFRYPAPARAINGCPFTTRDGAWAHDVGVPATNRDLGRAAAAVPGVRFLDLTGAFDGREACAEGITRASEWVLGVSIDLRQLQAGLGPNLVQQSLHPNAKAQGQIARCLRQFYALAAPRAHCRQGRDGNLSIDRT